ncbi:universal stress protein [Winogradskyella sp.]|uniref:universal stress protein n=1 Tax=Winogradskyella sp. TaxID=1883156 RepID=UPI0025F492B2|nr:universal stress protein [Winogradskyella sp.]
MKNILLLTDFSENSINAMRYALQLFKEDTCNFFVLHVEMSTSYISDDLMLAGNQSIYDVLIKKSKHALTKLVRELKSEFNNKNFNFEIIVDHDVLIDSINQAISSKTIDLIVMGTNGVTGAKEVVFGSNTINIIRKVDCPTLVIPEGFEYRIPNHILLPLDLFDSLSGTAFTDILKFTNRYCKKLHLLRIKPQNEDSKEALKDNNHINYFLKETNYEYHAINNIPTEHVVSCYTQTHHIDLTALIVQKESFFERFFIGSPTTEISNKIRVPLLISHS